MVQWQGSEIRPKETQGMQKESVTKKRKRFDIKELLSSDETTTDNENTSDDELN